MSGLNAIPIVVAERDPGPADWGNALPILHEVRHGLRRLAETGETTVIDLHAMPFGPGDEARLLAILGRGEVDASIQVLGPSRVWETAFPGVWLVEHRNAENDRLTLQLEISSVPEILRSQGEDIVDAIARLDARLGSDAGITRPSPTTA
jgi:hydrogenase-1 operon protein HyaF